MGYHPSYFEDEVREGFFVPSIIKMSWAYSKSNYDYLQQICEKKGIRCEAAYGAILGAVRHGGFVPWDDDIDVALLRKEFAKLLFISTQEKEYKFKITDDYFRPDPNPNFIQQFVRYEGLFTSPENIEGCFGFPFGNVIDLFVYDHVPRGESEKQILHDIFHAFFGMFFYMRELELKNGDTRIFLREVSSEMRGRLRSLEKIFGFKFHNDTPITLQLMERMGEFFGSYTSGGQSDERTFIADWYMNKNLIFKESAYEDWIEVPFEEGTMRIPVGYDHIMRKLYSNYVQPVQVWSNHNYPYFNNIEKKLKEGYGGSLLRYEYDKDKVEQNRNKNQGKISLQDELLNSINLFTEAHEFICQNVESSNQISSVLDTLAQCQELAIFLGERVEQRAVEPGTVISLLEKYCDVVYQLYQQLTGESVDSSCTIKDNCLKIKECEKRLVNKIISGVDEKREIVILTYKAKYWKALHTYWERVVSDEKNIVTVIAVPYYYRNFTGDLNREMHLETEGYPDGVELTSYQEYNFEVCHPDEIIYQFPYDEYNYALSLHPFYYCSNLRKYTDKMTIIPHHLLSEINDENDRAKYTLRWFVQTPGMVYADRILVQSEQMKRIYQGILEEFTKDDEIDWNNRIFAEGLPLQEWERRKRILLKNVKSGVYFTKEGDLTEKTIYDDVLSVPDSWLEKIFTTGHKRRKIVLYYVSGSVLHEFGGKSVNKIEQVLRVAGQHKEDILFFWYTDPYARKALRKNCPAVWTAYRKLVEDFSEKEYGIVDESGDYCRAAKLCDAFYGDGGTIMNECRLQGRPIMWENPDIS